jgi:hypothetical protein
MYLCANSSKYDFSKGYFSNNQSSINEKEKRRRGA